MARRPTNKVSNSKNTAPTKNKNVNNTSNSNVTGSTNSVSPSAQHSAAEMREWYEKNETSAKRFAEAQNALKNLRDATKTSTKTITAFNKETLRTYLQNIGSNEKNLRNLSRYLYYRCQAYFRLVAYNANMFEMGARSVIPEYSLTEENDVDSMLKNYEDTLTILDKMNLDFNILKAATNCFREDIFYGCYYFDETGGFTLPLDPDYAKIDGFYNGFGDFSFSYDMSWFKNRQDILEMWGEPFQSMYKEYEKTGIKYVHMVDEYACCFKIRAEDWETILPPYAGLLNSIINLIDIEDVQAVADKQSIFRLLNVPLKTLSGSKNENDWQISPEIMIEYVNRLIEEALPDYVTAVIAPGEIQNINLENATSTNDVNKIQKNTEVLFNTSGGAQILNSSTISGTTGLNAAIKSDTEFAISMLLPQFQAWVNRFLSYQVSKPCKVKFFPVSSYTKEDFKKSLLNDAQYGLPVKLAINTLNTFSEKDTLALNFFEEKVLHLSDKFVPLKSSHTSTGESDSPGAPTKSDGEISDDGEASRNKKDKSKG